MYLEMSGGRVSASGHRMVCEQELSAAMAAIVHEFY